MVGRFAHSGLPSIFPRLIEMIPTAAHLQEANAAGAAAIFDFHAPLRGQVADLADRLPGGLFIRVFQPSAEDLGEILQHQERWARVFLEAGHAQGEV